MSEPRNVILDNEAVQAIQDVGHPKHRRALAVVEAATAPRARRLGSFRLVVPTTIRVEAGWDRTASRAAVINRLRIIDHQLDSDAANRAASIRNALGVSVADAHLGSALGDSASENVVITSDVSDLRRIAGHLATATTVVRL
ncbi:MAG: hypothetical protein ACR2G7_00750 [Acidimicrobiales bacterium]